jgi:sulfonate transport system substrate-binding protein
VGAIDFGTVGEAPIFAQAAGAQLAYIGNEPPAHGGGHRRAEELARSGVADLRGKRVALNKGSNVHYLLVRQLKAGVASARSSLFTCRPPMRVPPSSEAPSMPG